jgi:predicted AAA+ superfamily ATPase
MLYLKRQIDLVVLLRKKSFFLLGPRSTGKTLCIKKTLPANIPYLSLNQTSLYTRLMADPSELAQILAPHKKIKMAIIDEIQKIPILLDEIQELIENEGFKFLLTGSSARKLKRSNANMLGGRAMSIRFNPLSFSEIPDFDLTKFLRWGGLPRVYLSEEPQVELESYIKTYLEEEIRFEANIRNLAPFHRFLKVAALSNGQLINYAAISSDAAVPASTVKQYFEILSDTLIASTLEPWLESKKRKAIQTSKFYFFDPGVTHFLAGTEKLDRNSNLWGECFEQFIFMELKCYSSYKQKNLEINFWRSTDKYEVDFVINGKIAIEVKSTKRINDSHLKGLKAIQQEAQINDFYVISEDPIERVKDKIHIMPWKTFLQQLWASKIL